jgi:hypothetical protein
MKPACHPSNTRTTGSMLPFLFSFFCLLCPIFPLFRQRGPGAWVFYGAGSKLWAFYTGLGRHGKAQGRAWHGIASSSKGVKRGLGCWGQKWMVGLERESETQVVCWPARPAWLGCLGALRLGCVALPFCSAVSWVASWWMVDERGPHKPPRHSAVLRRSAPAFLFDSLFHNYGLRLNLSA